MEQPTGRVRRRAVGPPGAKPEAPAGAERTVDHTDPADRVGPEDDDERFRADRPPHHDRER